MRAVVAAFVHHAGGHQQAAVGADADLVAIAIPAADRAGQEGDAPGAQADGRAVDAVGAAAPGGQHVVARKVGGLGRRRAQAGAEGFVAFGQQLRGRGRAAEGHVAGVVLELGRVGLCPAAAGDQQSQGDGSRAADLGQRGQLEAGKQRHGHGKWRVRRGCPEGWWRGAVRRGGFAIGYMLTAGLRGSQVSELASARPGVAVRRLMGAMTCMAACCRSMPRPAPAAQCQIGRAHV